MTEPNTPAPRRWPGATSLVLLLALLLAGCAHNGSPVATSEAGPCPPAGRWLDATGTVLTTAELAAEAADYEVILLGEEHGNLAQHRWQLLTLTAIHSHTPIKAVGLEMLPAEADDSLRAWSRGELSEEEWLLESGWYRHWGHPPDGYLPLLHFARMEQIPLRGINLDRATHSRLAGSDWEETPEALEGVVSPPVTPAPAYLERLREALADHPHGEMMDEARFISAQLLWDRAMAEGLKSLLAAQQGPVAGLMGRGHMSHGHGVPEQLADLGVHAVLTLLPYPAGEDCTAPADDLADALYGLAEDPEPPHRPLRLGIQVEPGEQGLKVIAVDSNSVAEQAGLQAGDELVEAAGRAVTTHGELLMILNNAREGFSLPIQIKRNGERKGLSALFSESS